MANPMKKILSTVKLASKAFQKTILTKDLLREDDFGDFQTRRLRYDINWSFYENTAYDDLHKWAVAYRSQFGLGRYIQGIYNPVFRLVEFWVGHIWGGAYDRELGDGSSIKTSLPIEFAEGAKEQEIKRALAQVYDWSNWQVNKNLVVRYGTALGDVGVRVVDDTSRQRIYYQVIHPGDIAEYEADPRGNVLDYTIEQERIDPEDPMGARTVVYREEVTNRDGVIQYITYKDGKEYPWFNGKASWTQEYGFTPMVFLKHMNIGADWGWAEFQPIRAKIHVLDDVSTALNNWVRVNSHAPWLFSGIKKPKETPSTSGAVATTDSRYPVKDNMRALYGPMGATAQELVSKMPVEEVGIWMGQLLEEIEKDFPELSKELWDAQETSARAIRIKRQRTEKKAEERRATYDDALRRLNMMAMSIGARRGYEAFKGLSVNSYESGELNHFIAPRPVFATDELEDLEIEKSFWEAAKMAREAGFSLETWLARKGWTDDEINEWKNSEEYEIRMKLQSMALDQEALQPLQDQGGRPEENGSGKEKNPDREDD